MKTKVVTTMMIMLFLVVMIPALPAKADPGVLFKDTFTRTEWASLTGPWDGGYTMGGTWAVEAGEFSAQATPMYVATALAGDTSWTDYTVTVRAKDLDASGVGHWRHGVLLRWIDSNNFVIFHGTGDPDEFYVYKRVAGTPTLLWHGGTSGAENTWYTYRIRAMGSTFNFYVQGGAYSTETLLTTLTIPDPALQLGAIALQSWANGSATHTHFDDVIVKNLADVILFEDHFDWQVIRGVWKVLDYEYQQIANLYIPGACAFAGDTSWTDYSMIAKVKITDDGWGGLLLRGNAAGDTYYELYLQRGGYLQLVKTVGGSRTWPGGVWNSPQFRVFVGSFADQWWYIKAAVSGNNIKGKAWPVSGSEPATWQIDWTDTYSPAIANGRIGLITFSWSSSQLPVYFDDVIVTARYYLTVQTAPAGIVTISGEGWYDECTSVELTAPSGPVSGPSGYQYFFLEWDVDGTSQGTGVNPITVHMDGPHTATAHYVTPQTLDFSWSGPATVIKGTTATYTASYTITSNVDLTNVKVQGGIGAKAKNIKIYFDGVLVDTLPNLEESKGWPLPDVGTLKLDVSKRNNVFVLKIDSMAEGKSHTLRVEFDWTFTSTGTEKITGSWSAVCISNFGELKTPYTDTITVEVARE